ncbi:ABC transporter ATP-binding protein [Halalkalibacillus halophilus]|uniref:ABC transporter ATP-binding protein n=1 Tax=Halalkalibacillus halophilus TaxID=392827 RepID=UPI00042073EF|nr:ABC transporter ATP-binding protein [Halalkalibacillus halophilus]
MEDAVIFSNVNKSYQGFQIKDLSLSVKKGYITGFIGPNGAGKTTTIKLMLNLLEQDSGAIKVFGDDYSNHQKDIRQRIGFIYADHQLYEHLTIKKMKKIIAPFYSKWDDDVFAYYMKRLDLPWNRKIKYLSKGMTTKLSIAIALSHHADLMILDEPTSGLDPISRREIIDILTDVIQDEEKTIFFSTHIISDIEQIADYITLINDGRIILNEDKETMKEQHYIVRGACELIDSDIRKLFLQIRETSIGFEALTNQPEVVRKLMGDYIVMERASLEDIMVYTLGDF